MSSTEIEELRTELAALRRRVALLEDRAEIEQLVAQYGPAVDSGSAEAAAALWSEQGTFDVAGVIAMHGREQIAGMVDGEMHQGLIRNGCGHILTVPHIEIDGDTATGRSYALNIQWDPAVGSFRVARLSANTWRWGRTAEGWRVDERVNVNLDGNPDARTVLAPMRAAGEE